MHKVRPNHSYLAFLFHFSFFGSLSSFFLTRFILHINPRFLTFILTSLLLLFDDWHKYKLSFDVTTATATTTTPFASISNHYASAFLNNHFPPSPDFISQTSYRCRHRSYRLYEYWCPLHVPFGSHFSPRRLWGSGVPIGVC